MKSYVTFGFLLIAVASWPGARAASIPANRDSYENLPIEQSSDSDDIQENLIGDEYDFVPGLYPPKETAKDYYAGTYDQPKQEEQPTTELASKYVIDTVNKVLRLKTDDASLVQETKLTPSEEEEIRKLSAAFAELLTDAKLEKYDWENPTQTPTSPEPVESTEKISEPDNWRNLNPVITLSKTGLTIEFVNDSSSENATVFSFGQQKSEDDDDFTTDYTPEEDRESVWDLLTQSVHKLLTEELEKKANITEALEDLIATTEIEDTTTDEVPATEEQAKEQAALNRFVDSMWDLMNTSISYLGSLFDGLIREEQSTETTPASNASTTAPPSTAEPSTSQAPAETEAKTSSSSTTTLFAYEEPARYHRFPSQEFEKRGRDIDSILYGHGIA